MNLEWKMIYPVQAMELGRAFSMGGLAGFPFVGVTG
jgi:hypothetical protein